MNEVNEYSFRRQCHRDKSRRDMNWHGTVVEETILKFSQYRILPPVSRHQKVLPSLCFLVLGSAEGEIAESSSHSICDVFCCGNRICSVSGWMRARI